jgi:hypothetical protein
MIGEQAIELINIALLPMRFNAHKLHNIIEG